MRISSLFAVGLTFVVAAILSLVAAGFAVSAVEDSTEIGVRRSLDDAGHHWAEVEADGLRVVLAGIAPDEATRFNAITVAAQVVDAARVIDNMEIAPTADLTPPRFSIEVLRNDSGISIIGLVPVETDRDDLVAELKDIAGTQKVADLLETAAYPTPEGWDAAMQYAVEALRALPRSKVSVSAGQVKITAIADSREAKAALERKLTRAAPAGLRLGLEIAAPRPVITPFSLRFIIDENGGHFDACSAETDAAGARILAAGRAAGLSGEASCTIGMGVPSPNWARAAELSLSALAKLGAGSVTFADADITLVAAQGTNAGLFDAVVGELENDLPEVFALHAVLPAPKDTAGGPPEFIATRSPEGLVQLRGRLNDDNLRRMADSYARARFGSESVHTAARLVEGLPADWPVRVLAGLEALSKLAHGVVTVSPDSVRLSGVTHDEEASADIAGLLSDKLGEAEDFTLDITYQAPPEPVAASPEPEECERRLSAAQETGKITFEPGSATIAAASQGIMNQIADILTECQDLRLEIQGHTDSQGREEMNLTLSQSRAQSVLNELRARRVLTASFVAVGYGETRPIAPNDTEAGREANRRIEFRLIRPGNEAEEESTLDAVAEETPITEPADDNAAPMDDAGNDEETGAEPETDSSGETSE
ncbi:OmpA family protein [Antarcticimicrobium sediminis]|uniref:OmpA family protein n=1 Tax=Antarcticimicrobium sediminis TaxID=2546227 RepID=A0A4R5EXY2_9RHOB|nr:OmpA family protein [Antarcticimicrobium sediminis]TDE39792.1 OmpA family protein [Antarcticimicrobium sediminis]